MPGRAEHHEPIQLLFILCSLQSYLSYICFFSQSAVSNWATTSTSSIPGFFQEVYQVQKFVLYKLFYFSHMTQTAPFLTEVMRQTSHDQVITKLPSFLWRITSPCSTPDVCQPFLATASITHTFINILSVLNYNWVYWYAKRQWKRREEISNINIIDIKLSGLGTVDSAVKRCFN